MKTNLPGPSLTAARLARLFLTALTIGVTVLIVGCGNAAQEQAYERALKMEQQLSSENSAAVIAEYRRVIRMKPGSACAQKAETRLKEIEAKVKAEELHKSVFQEHGVD